MFDAISRSEPERAVESAATVPVAGGARLPRSAGAVRIAFLGVGGRTALADLHQSGSLKARLPKSYAGEPPTAVLINTSGGLTGGDSATTDVRIGDGALACITTQAAERVYRSSGGSATVRNRLTVGAGAGAEWLPQETIMFDGGRLERQTLIDLQPTSRLLALESVVLGRRAMGETVREGLLDDRLDVRLAGLPLLWDSFRLESDIAGMAARPAILDGAAAWATLLVVDSDSDGALSWLRGRLGPAGGATRRGPLVLARVAVAHGDPLRALLAGVLPDLRHRIFGHAARLPRVFNC